ncbi:MAG: hypothetical protein LLF99_11280 [Desulfobacteraceae bacterium]|nr:hypothetical protein [Desulfobacteraceae bacterium]
METSPQGSLDEASLRAARLIQDSSPGAAHYQKKMAACLFEIAHQDHLEGFRASGVLPAEAMKTFRKVLRLYDASALHMLGMLRRSGMSVSCRLGCTHCCRHMPAGVSSLEMIAIYQAMDQSGLKNRIFRRCLEAEWVWHEICRRHRKGLLEGDEGDTPREVVLKAYQAAAHPCPFLGNGRCVVYPYRPFACRMHFSFSPKHWCDPAHFQSPYAVRFNLEPDPEVLDELDRLDERLGLDLSDVLVCGLLELMVNVMRFGPVRCI